ncbi:putative inorganic phosphate cotransporter [Fopius arisanus]|uniref:Inorganic phosphate cotransporter n=1 Tax=Fopius arisanus TaxID=64838 RepID=A0A0C9RBW9_9HYME|nr:PREDICTED: putative inorganic phosphate cotransporter [Fopius arisanus]
MSLPKSDSDTPKESSPRGFGVRHCQCILLFLSYGIAYTTRTCLSLVIVGIKEEQESFQQDVLTQGQVGVILSSFLWGYAIAQIPIGHMTRIWSAKMILVIGLLISGVFSILSPVIFERGGWVYLCVSRIIMGLCQACLPPCCHTLLSKWAPPRERGRICSVVFSGATFGTLIAPPISGVLIAADGWRSPFYVFGVGAVVSAVILLIAGSDSPATAVGKFCCGISEAERKYIESSLGLCEEKTTGERQTSKTPWRAILTNAPFWALLTVHCGYKWGHYMLLTEMPIYMDGVLGFNIKENGVKSALPYIALLLLTIPVSCFSDWSEKKGVSRGFSRKLCNTIGQWGQGLALIGIVFVTPGDTTVPVLLLIVAVGLAAPTMCGYQINHMDLSLDYAGLLVSITNAVSSIAGLLAPLVVGIIVTDSHDIEQWKIIFLISGGIYFVGNFIFILFGSGETQQWNNSEDRGEFNNEKFRSRISSIDSS